MSELERWEARYAEPGYLFGTEPNAFLKSKAHLLKPGQKALCRRRRRRPQRRVSRRARPRRAGDRYLADRPGEGAARLPRSAASRCAPSRPTWQPGTGRSRRSTSWSPSSFSSAPPTVRAEVFAGIKRALKPGGLLLMEGYRPEQLKYKTGGPSEVERLYTRALLEQAFGDFSSLEIEEHDSVVSEGSRPRRHGRADRSRRTQVNPPAEDEHDQGASHRPRRPSRRPISPRPIDYYTQVAGLALAARETEPRIPRNQDRPARDRAAAGRAEPVAASCRSRSRRTPISPTCRNICPATA